MPGRRQLGREQTYRAIVDAAASVLADPAAEEARSMQRIAQEAGVGRATLYRHFESRHALLSELARATVQDAGQGLRDANLEERPFDEALAAALHVLCSVGDRYIAVFLNRVPIAADQLQEQVGARIEALMARGQREGLIRDSVPPILLREALGALVRGLLRSPLFPDRAEREQAIRDLFLVGAATDAGRPAAVGAGAEAGS